MTSDVVNAGPSRRALLMAGATGLAAPMLLRSARAQSDAFRVGLLQSLTGATAGAGWAAVIGIRLALETIEKQGGIAGRKVQAILVDDQSDTTAGVSLAKKLIEANKVHFILGPQFSQVVLAMLPLATKAEIPQISAAGSSEVTPLVGPFHFSMNASAGLNGQQMASRALQLTKSRRIAYLSDTGAQSKATLEAVQRALLANGVTLVATQQFQYRSSDITPQLLSLQRSNPDVILLADSTGEDTATMARGLSEIGWEVRVVGNIAVGTLAPTALRSATPEQLSTFEGLSYRSATYCPGGTADPGYVELVRRALAADTERTTVNTAAWYDATILMKSAVEGAGSSKGAAVAKWIEQNAKNHAGIYGALDASPDNHFLFGPDTVAMVKIATGKADGTAERVTC